MAIYRVLIEYTYDPMGPNGKPIEGAKRTWAPGQTLEYPGATFPTPIPVELLTTGQNRTLEKAS